MTEKQIAKQMPALALRGLTVYPHMMIHFDVGREASVRALEAAMNTGQSIFLVAQRDLRVEEPEQEDLFPVGTISNVRQILRMPGKSIRVMVEGTSRGRLHAITQSEPYLMAEVEELESASPAKISVKGEALVRSAYELFERYTELSPRMSGDMLVNVLASENPDYIADFIAQNIVMRVLDKQAILEEARPLVRLQKLLRLLAREVEILEMEQEIQSKVQENLSQLQRDAVLREQMKVISRELGESSGQAPGAESEVNTYRRRIHEAKLPEAVEVKLLKEVAHLERQHFGSTSAYPLER